MAYSKGAILQCSVVSLSNMVMLWSVRDGDFIYDTIFSTPHVLELFSHVLPSIIHSNLLDLSLFLAQ